MSVNKQTHDRDKRNYIFPVLKINSYQPKFLCPAIINKIFSIKKNNREISLRQKGKLGNT